MEASDRIDSLLAVLGALVPLCSALASLLNHVVRLKSANGEQPSKLLLGAGSLLNVASVNLDKGVQLAKMALGKPVPSTAAPAVAPPDADKTQEPQQ